MPPRDIAAIIIAAGIILWGLVAFIALAYNDRQLGEVGGEALTAIGGALVGALAGYLAGSGTKPK